LWCLRVCAVLVEILALALVQLGTASSSASRHFVTNKCFACRNVSLVWPGKGAASKRCGAKMQRVLACWVLAVPESGSWVLGCLVQLCSCAALLLLGLSILSITLSHINHK
jgi:hypothetical protein